MSFRELLRVFWRRKLIVLVVFAVVVGSAVFYVSRQEDVYESTGAIAVYPVSTDAAVISSHAGIIQTLIPTYGQVIASETFLDDVSGSLVGDLEDIGLVGRVSVDPSVESGVIAVSARADNPTDAAIIANGITEEFVDQEGANGLVRLQVIDEARPANAPVAPKPTLTIVAAIVLGLLLAAGAALAWDRLFGRIVTGAELADAAGVPLLGRIPTDRRLRDRPPVIVSAELQAVDEAIREIRANLLFVLGSQQLSVAITSLNAGEGKSFLASNLAVSVGESGTSVLIVDADLRRPVQHQIFGVPQRPGLSNTVLNEAEPGRLPADTAYENVRVVPSGPPITRRGEEVELFLHAIPRFKEFANVIVVDTPPLRTTPDVRLLGVATDGVVLIVESGSVRTAEVRHAIDSLAAVGAQVAGVVLGKAPEHDLAPSISYGYAHPVESRGGRPSTTLAPVADPSEVAPTPTPTASSAPTSKTPGKMRIVKRRSGNGEAATRQIERAD